MFVLYLLGCVGSITDEPGLYRVTDVLFEQDGLVTALPDADIRFFGASSSDEGLCVSTIRLELSSATSDYQAIIDLTAYTPRTAVVSPDPPLGDWPPTLIFMDPTRYITGGPVFFESDFAGEDPVHTLRFDAPSLCTGSPRERETPCVPGGSAALTFTGDFSARAYCNTDAQPGDVFAPDGRPYCARDWDDVGELCIDGDL